MARLSFIKRRSGVSTRDWRGSNSDLAVRRVDVAAYTIPTDKPESDGTLRWDKTTLVAVHISAGGEVGFGYAFGDTAVAKLIAGTLAPLVLDRDAFDIPLCWAAMRHHIRNLGRPGLVSMAMSAIDIALWDLKARLLRLPLTRLLGAVRPEILAYGSGGFTSYSITELQRQLGGWAHQGFKAVKMKVGREPDRDVERVRAARAAIGPGVALFVDANGAYSRKQALDFAQRFAEFGVSWFEEPVSSNDVAGLRLMRDRAPAGMSITTGEYAYDLAAFRDLLQAQAVDVLQADAKRCAGFSEFMRVGAMCMAAEVPLSSHTAPALHVPMGCSLEAMANIEYLHDHARIENLLFDGVIQPRNGMLRFDASRPGLGFELKTRDAQRYAA